MNHTLKENSSSKRGVVLLISVLVASVALAVGLGVYQRTYKELYFSSFWKQTQIAASAADSGLECANYWNLHPSVTPECFETSIPGLVASGGGGATYTYSGFLSFLSNPVPQCSCDTGGAYECNPSGVGGGTFIGTDVGLICYDRWSGGVPSQIFERTASGGVADVPSGSFDLDTYNGCVKVTITKPSPSGLSTRIEARGYNNTCATITTNPRTVERGLYVEY